MDVLEINGKNYPELRGLLIINLSAELLFWLKQNLRSEGEYRVTQIKEFTDIFDPLKAQEADLPDLLVRTCFAVKNIPDSQANDYWGWNEIYKVVILIRPSGYYLIKEKIEPIVSS